MWHSNGTPQKRCIPGSGLGGRNLRQAEVEYLGVAALGDENIRRLDVAVDDAFAVRGVESVGDLDRHLEQNLEIKRAVRDAVL